MPNPVYTKAIMEQALLLLQQGAKDQSLAILEQALQQFPLDAALIHQDLGTILLLAGQVDTALQHYEHAIALAPETATAHMHYGNALLAMNRRHEAITSYRQAIFHDPSLADAHHNLGYALLLDKQSTEAARSFEAAIACNPCHHFALNSLGHVHLVSNRIELALHYFSQATDLQPDFADAQFNKALALLMAGEFHAGWALHHWRWRASHFHSPYLTTSKPLWSSSATGKRLLIWPEQGIGDEILFCSLLPVAAPLAGTLLVQTDERLMPLMKRSFPHIHFYPKSKNISESLYDCHMPMGDLPLHLWDRFVAKTSQRRAFMKSDPTRSQVLRSRLACPGKILCGISWISHAKQQAGRNLALADLLKAIHHPDIVFINLQYGDASADIADARAKTGIDVIGCDDIDNFHDIEGLAALIDTCDMVISMANTTVHLAGALGKETCALIPFSPSWRWQLDRQDNPWYPSVRLYRQATEYDWSAPLQQIAAAIHTRFQT